MKNPDFNTWVAQNRDELVRRFSERYGRQIQEWYDFLEQEYDEAFPDKGRPCGLDCA